MQFRRTNLDRETPFAFSCMRCLACCRDKKIQVNPYEIVRLAQNRGLATSDLIDQYTTDGGRFLKWDGEGYCVFLDSHGCNVHEDRPLVCRLYPLARHVNNNFDESFSEMETHMECRGVYGDDGRVIDYLESEGAIPFMEAADSYLSLFWHLYELLEKKAARKINHNNAVDSIRMPMSGSKGYDILKDVDRTVSEYCGDLKIPFPKNLEKRISIHIRAIKAWADNSQGG